MGFVDLSDAQYTVNVAYSDRKYLRFIWKGTLNQYTCLPNGLSSAPRCFTKLLKPVYTSLRCKGHVSVAYIDDSYLQGETYEHCLKTYKTQKNYLNNWDLRSIENNQWWYLHMKLYFQNLF